jgi:hypothetical protein
MVYLVAYNLNRPGQNYPELYSALQSYTYVKDPQLDSVWFISSSQSVGDIYNALLPHIDTTDRLWVSRINSEHMGWLSPEVVDWLRVQPI